MATCYPDYGDDESPFKSRGELTFYRACQRSLSPEYSIFHSVSWIAWSAVPLWKALPIELMMRQELPGQNGPAFLSMPGGSYTNGFGG